MPTARLKIKPVNHSVAEFSADHPDKEYRYLASRRVEDSVHMIIEVKTTDYGALVQTFKEAPEVRSHEMLRTDQETVLLQYVEDSEPAPITTARTAGIMPQYPVILRNGWLIVETITSRKRLSRLNTEFERTEIPFEILSVIQQVDVTKLLTDRHWKLITEALERGYYDSPRGCTLTELAAEMEVNPSAVSGVLHRAEEQIIRTFVAETNRSTR